MKGLHLKFSENELRKVFPFYVLMDSNLNIVQVGESMHKMTGEIYGSRFDEVFRLVRPVMSLQKEKFSIEEVLDKLVIVETSQFPVKSLFRGQFLSFEEENLIIYLCNPWFSDLSQFGVFNLSLSDFALNDTLPDLLNVLKSRDLAQEDLIRHSEELLSERNKLLDKNREIEILAKFQEQNPQPVMRISSNGDLLYFNHAAEEIIKDDLFAAKENRKSFFDRFKTPSELELNLGSLHYSVNIVPFAEDGYINLYLKDITQNKIYQDQLEIVNNQFSTLINSMRSALLVEDLDRKIIMLNDQFCEFFGLPFPKEQMIGVDCELAGEQSKLLFKDEEGFLDGVQVAIRGKKVISGEQLTLKDGRIFERDYIPLIQDGEIRGHIWKYDDVTEVIRSKESLKRVEEKYKKIMEELQFGLLEVDLDQRITKAFPAFCAMTGYTEEELIGQLAYEKLSFPDESEKIEVFNDDRKKGVSSVYETRIRTKGGEVRTVIISGSPIFDIDGNVVGSIGVHIDITDRKRLEMELREAQEKALSNVRAKDMFVAKVSHEIRTPMNVIIGLSDVLNDSGLKPEQLKLLSSIRSSASNLLGIINDILDFSILDNDQYKFRSACFDPISLMEELEEIFSMEARKKGVDLSFKCDEDIHRYLEGDKQRLNQVLINLISNAIKFTKEGYVKIGLQLVNDDPDSQQLWFKVEDSGVGIKPEAIEHIFDDFQQEDDNVSVNYGGSGLGLSISQMIIRKMGGEIKVESKKGEGSIFQFQLKFKKRESIPEKVQPVDLSGLNTRISILVAEDNKQNQLLIETILRRAGFDFTMVENGLEVLDELSRRQYDLILMDIQMPQMDGLEALKCIRDSGDQIPALALTANASESDRVKYLDAGFQEVVVKPFKKDELFEVMYRLTGTISNDEVLKTSNQKSTEVISNEKPLFSLKDIEDLTDNDPVVMRELLDAFLDNVPVLIDQICKGLYSGEIEQVKFATHQIKPSLKIFKAFLVLEKVELIEGAIASEKKNDHLKDLAEELLQTSRQMVLALRNEVKY